MSRADTASFWFDVLACARRAERLRLVALIQQPAIIQRILRHLGLPAEVPVMRPAREPLLVGNRDEELTTSPDA